jgi:hypothetical protein
VLQSQESVLQALVEDAQCRHSLACAKLQGLLAPLLQAEQPSVSHLHHLLRNTPNTEEEHKITTAYQVTLVENF